MKKDYITPKTSIFNVSPVSIIADSNLEKGSGDFDPGTMTFTRENNAWDIWDEGNMDEE